MAHTERLGQLRENLVEYFSQEELRSLCFDLGVDWDRLRGEEKAGKVTALLTSLDNTGRIPELTERCTGLRPNVLWQEILQAAEAPSPFKGLQYFDEADADLFFGRELLTAKLITRLAPSPATAGEGWGGGRFLGVVGASGSGKSSVVRAGLVPAFRRGEPLADGTLTPEGSTRWPVHIITPTHHPLESLAASLTRDSESVTATATLMDDLARWLPGQQRDLASRLPMLDIPTLVVWGEADQINSIENGRTLAELQPTARLVTIPGAGHNVHQENAEAVLKAIHEWIAGA